MPAARNTTYSIIRETTPGVTPATPAFLNVDYYPGNDLTFTATMRNSEAMTKDRSLAAAVLTQKTGGGSLKVSARRDPVNDMLLEAAIGSTGLTASATGTATSGFADLSHTIEKKMKLDVDSYHRFTESYVTKAVISGDASTNASVVYDFLLKDRATGTTVITGATYPVTVQGAEIGSSDVVITIGGSTAVYTSFELTIEQPREPIFGLGSNVAAQINASQSPRLTNLNVSMLRSSLAIDALGGTNVSATVVIGSGAGNRYTFELPNCAVSLPEDSVQSSSMVVSLMLTGQRDATLGSSLKITKS